MTEFKFITKSTTYNEAMLSGNSSVSRQINPKAAEKNRWHYQTRAEAKTDIFHHIEIFYNRQRRHSDVRHMKPDQYNRLVRKEGHQSSSMVNLAEVRASRARDRLGAKG